MCDFNNATRTARLLTGAKIFRVAVGTNWVAVVRALLNSSEQSFTLWQCFVAILQCSRFLWLVAQYSEMRLVPNKEIDAVVHALEQTPTFNRYFNHQPGLGTRGEEDRQDWLNAFQATRERFERHFGVGSMGNTQAAHCDLVDYRFDRFLSGKARPADCEVYLKAQPAKCEVYFKAQPAACEVCLKVAV